MQVRSQVNQYANSFVTDDGGNLAVPGLSYGPYSVTVEGKGFAAASKTIEIRSALPVDSSIKLEVAAVDATIEVNDKQTLIDPNRPSSIMQIGSKEIDKRVASLPGRSIQDLVNTQPGWLYEGNAVLHPRGSEYQTQFVVDGVPLTDNRSPSFGPEIEADDIDSVSIYTAGFPAEYGRKMGGVVELNTKHYDDSALHGQVIAAGGSYDTAQGYTRVQNTWNKNTLGASASGSMTSHYLNPVVPQNYTNAGTTGDFAVKYDRDFTAKDRLTMSVRHELARYEIPNELVQQNGGPIQPGDVYPGGQLQTGDNFETMGTVNYQHIFSPDVLGTLSGFVRNNQNDLYSNQNSYPIIFDLNNYFNEGYFKGTLSWHYKNQEWKAGVESDNTFLHEKWNYVITDPNQYDDGTPLVFGFAQHRPDLEQSAFVEDLIRLGKWTVSAGLRWDHYQLVVNQNNFSPRVSVGRYFPSLKLVGHFSYDRIFQTPSFENILAASSPLINAIDPAVLRLPVKPSTGTYYEGGFTEAFSDKLKLDVNFFRRDERNFADDDEIESTTVSYPIAFDKAILYGAETKISLVNTGKLSGYVSYSYIVGNAWFPVTGGLFVGDDVTNALTQLTGHFPDSQDQRNTLRSRFQYQALPRLWLSSGVSYGSGLPFDFDGDPSQVLAEYGQTVLNRLNFSRGRILPTLAISASMGIDLYKTDRIQTRFQVDGDNLNNRLNVIDFGGLFSGNAIGPGRSFIARLNTSF
ncbi:Zinc-regulated outer membrane receptor [Acidisarcina polymorpha]|uniref:Zinc-regulated outer membrane receptor n=1 Tax=Acidisarcina polymorpha TaxID=2211140 RepID=A0A2Z5G2M6_9BACT|nr:Zinc-regulated outer membrane receptor [Acidisarcina polymorpha]